MEYRGKPPEEQPAGTFKAYQTRMEKRDEEATKKFAAKSRMHTLESLFTSVNNEIDERRAVRAPPAHPRGHALLREFAPYALPGLCRGTAPCLGMLPAAAAARQLHSLSLTRPPDCFGRGAVANGSS
jgi:hypothetical protein